MTFLLLAWFAVLMWLKLRGPSARSAMAARSTHEWALDLANLMVQGIAVPAAAAWLGPRLWSGWIASGSWRFSFVQSFMIQFVVIDWLYYWNHRLLHRLWPVHRVHHTATSMDIWVTSRNTLWSSFFLVYFWSNTLFLHALADDRGYRVGIALTAALDLWRHSDLPGRLPGLILPRNHSWHHASDREVNFGANWSWWDRLHGTWYDPAEAPRSLGVPTSLSALRQALWPFETTR